MTDVNTKPINTNVAPDWKLPNILEVDVFRKTYQPPPPKNFKSPFPTVEDAIEIILTFDSPMPIRALGPVLWVGDERLTESEAVDKEDRNKLRFWALQTENLKEGAQISLIWSDDSRPEFSEKSGFEFRMPE